MVDRHVLQVRKHPRHRLAHLGRDVPGEPVAIAFATAEQQTVVVAEAEVVHHEHVVRHGDIARQHAGRIVAQGRGRGHEIVDRHHPRRDLPVQPAEVAVAGQDQMPCVDLAQGGVHHHLAAPVDPFDARIFVNPGARIFGGAGQPKRIAQRMKVPRAHVQHPALVGGRGAEIVERLRVQRLDLVIAVSVAQVVGILGQMHGLAVGRRGPGDAGFQVAFDSVPPDQVTDQILGLFSQRPQVAGVVRTHHSFQRLLVLPLARSQLPAVPPRCAEPHALRLDQHHAQSGLGQMQRGGQPGIAAADHADIGPRGPGQGRARGGDVGGRGIPGRRVFPGAVVGVEQVHTFIKRCSRSHGEMTERNSSYSVRFTME